MELWVKYDTITGKTIATSVAPGSFIAEEFDVSTGGVANVVLATTIDVGTKIEVLINGAKKREGASFDWQRNVGLNRIDFNYTVLANAWIEVKIYP
jgi:hypothetical protein